MNRTPLLAAVLLTLAVPVTAQDAEPVAQALARTPEPVAVPEPEPAPELITLNVRETPLGQVLETISVRQRINIVAGVDTNVPVTVSFFDASVEESLDWVLAPLGLGWYFDGKVYSVLPAAELEVLEQPLVHALLQLNYVSAQEMERFLIPFLSPHGRIVMSDAAGQGIPSGAEEAGGNSSVVQEMLVMIDNQATVDHLLELAAEFDTRPRQVLVEATMVEVKLDETNRFGVDISILGGGDFSDFESLTAMGEVFSDPTVIAPGEFGPAGIAAGAPFLTPNGTNSFNQSGFTFPDSDSGLRIGLVGGDAAIFVEALQEIADTNVLANTKVLALNKQRGEIIIGGRLGYFGATTVSQGVSQQTVEFLEVGTQLRFRPYIGDDGFVRLEIHPQRSSGQIDTETSLPTELTSEVTTNVLLRDGETVVIGGLIETRDISTVSRVPVLGYLPGIGWLFTSEHTEVERSEIIVMLTPHILENGERHEDGDQIKDDAVRDRDEFRDQFGVESRAVYANRLLEDARLAMEAGRLDEARMLCDRALLLDALADGAVDLSVEIDERLAEAGK